MLLESKTLTLVKKILVNSGVSTLLLESTTNHHLSLSLPTIPAYIYRAFKTKMAETHVLDKIARHAIIVKHITLFQRSYLSGLTANKPILDKHIQAKAGLGSYPKGLLQRTTSVTNSMA